MDDADAANREVRLRGAAAVKLHATLAAGLLLCATGFGIETWRAVGGNTLSWVYVFEWPLLAVFAVYMWWQLLHGYDRKARASSPTEAASPQIDEDDPELEAWRRYVATLDDDGS